MGIARYENITVNSLAFSKSSFGEQTTTVSKWFDTRALLHNVANSLLVTDALRVYSDVINITLNYTPNTRTIMDDQNAYSITWRSKDWKIVTTKETNDRMNVILTCARNDPGTAV